MSNGSRPLRALIEGRPALIVIDIQGELFGPKDDMAIPEMPGFDERMARSRIASTRHGRGTFR